MNETIFFLFRMLLRIFLCALAALLQVERGDSYYYSSICNRYARFRTFDGTCNNLQRPTDGAAGTAFGRLLPPAYDDGIDVPRGGQNGLPNPRNVSLALFRDVNRPNTRLTHMAMTFGQFLAHDITGLGKTGLGFCC